MAQQNPPFCPLHNEKQAVLQQIIGKYPLDCKSLLFLISQLVLTFPHDHSQVPPRHLNHSLTLGLQSIMVNPGAFKGLRKEFLISEKPVYNAGINGGYTKDAVVNIQHRYFKRFPLDLPHDEEPMQEHLDAVDDDGPDTEPEAPDEEALGPKEYTETMNLLDE